MHGKVSVRQLPNHLGCCRHPMLHFCASCPSCLLRAWCSPAAVTAVHPHQWQRLLACSCCRFYALRGSYSSAGRSLLLTRSLKAR